MATTTSCKFRLVWCHPSCYKMDAARMELIRSSTNQGGKLLCFKTPWKFLDWLVQEQGNSPEYLLLAGYEQMKEIMGHVASSLTPPVALLILSAWDGEAQRASAWLLRGCPASGPAFVCRSLSSVLQTLDKLLPYQFIKSLPVVRAARGGNQQAVASHAMAPVLAGLEMRMQRSMDDQVFLILAHNDDLVQPFVLLVSPWALQLLVAAAPNVIAEFLSAAAPAVYED